MDLTYPRHAIVYFENIAAAEDAATTQNQRFEANRQKFPRNKGWHVEIVHSGSDNGKIKPKPLARPNGHDPHPWMRAYRNRGKLDARCARILYCVGMAREGVNNPLCGLTGVACRIRSLVWATQGPIGRQGRSVVELINDVLHVPPAPLDTIRLITHKAYDNISTIQAAIEFLCNMDEHFQGLRGIDDLSDDSESEKPKQPAATVAVLSRKDKLQILGGIIDMQDEGVEPVVDKIVDGCCPQPGPRQDRIREWVNICIGKDPSKLRRELRLDEDIAPIVVVRNETLKHDPSDEDLERFIRTHHPKLNNTLPLNEAAKQIAIEFYADHAEKFQQPRLTATTSINTLAHGIAFTAIADLGKYFQGDAGRVFPCATKAVRLKLGVPREQKLKNDSDWDTPETHALIRRPDIQNELIRWIIARLIEEGYCPKLETTLSEARSAYEA
jgi:hypothetical protein